MYTEIIHFMFKGLLSLLLQKFPFILIKKLLMQTTNIKVKFYFLEDVRILRPHIRKHQYWKKLPFQSNGKTAEEEQVLDIFEVCVFGKSLLAKSIL